MCVQARDFPLMTSNWSSPTDPQQSILFAAVWTLAKHTSQTESRLPSPNDRVNLARPSKEGPSLSLSFSSMCTARSVRLTLCVKSNSRVVRRVIRNLRNLEGPPLSRVRQRSLFLVEPLSQYTHHRHHTSSLPKVGPG